MYDIEHAIFPNMFSKLNKKRMKVHKKKDPYSIENIGKYKFPQNKNHSTTKKTK